MERLKKNPRISPKSSNLSAVVNLKKMRYPQSIAKPKSFWDSSIAKSGCAQPRGHLNLGLSHDTTQFACDSLGWYWNRIGKRCYPDASSILLLCDCGGSNAANKYIFKSDLQRLADRIGIEIRIAHYPSYCSKYNPIERRFFPHVGRACDGMLFDSIETVVELMRKASTATGLKTTVNVIARPYLTGRNATDEIKHNLKIVADDVLSKWNYRAIPHNPTVVF